MRDALADLIRGERDTLLRAAPAPHVGRLWHEARRRRAATLRRVSMAVGWLVRLAVAAATVATLMPWRSESSLSLLLLGLSVWLTRGACAASPNLSKKGIIR